MKKKIQSFNTILKKTEQLRKEGKKIVFCHGVFHFLHIGHIRYLKQAKNYGDFLIVALIADKYIDKKEDIQFDELLRSEAVASLDWIDAVVINPFRSDLEIVEHIRPDVFVKGFESIEDSREHESELEHQIKLFEDIDVRLIIAKENEFNSTSQINKYMQNLPEEIHRYIEIFKKRYSLNSILGTISAMRDLNVLVIGDTILDDYYYCSAIGKSSKDPTLALKYQSNDVFAGGILAIANHVAGFTSNVDLITVIGEKDSYEDFIRENLRECIQPILFTKPNAPTLIKRRFLDSYSMTKLLEVYIMNDSTLKGSFDDNFFQMIKKKLKKYDVVIVGDFGHGAINMNLKNLLSEKSLYLAVNAQSNAGNRGFNNITQYPRADYITMAEHEIRLETRDINGRVWPMMNRLAGKMSCDKFAVTRGRKGCMMHDRDEGGFIQVPSFAQKVVDRVGAGDAFFSITSLSVSQKNVPIEVIGFLGNVAGSLSVEMMGNKKSIDNKNVVDYISGLLS